MTTRNSKIFSLLFSALFLPLVAYAQIPDMTTSDTAISSEIIPSVIPTPLLQITKEVKVADAPDKITDLHVERASSKTVIVTWTAPHDNSGKIVGYDARLSRDPITEKNWDSAISFPGSPSDSLSGAKEKMEFGQLPEETTLYIAIKASDATGHISPISNVIETNTSVNISALVTTPQPNNSDPQAVVSGESNIQTNIDTTDFGTVKISLQTPDGLPVGFPVYVNFIDSISGLSSGGPTVNGLGNYKIRAGDYYVKMIIIDTDYREPENPIMFHIDPSGEDDLGVVILRNKDTTDGISKLTDLANSQGGTGKILASIVALLGEILSTLQKIAVKLHV